MSTATAPAALLALVSAVGLLLAAEMGRQAPRHWVPPARVELVLGDTYHRLDQGRFSWLQQFTDRHFAEGGDEARQLVAREIDRQLTPVFDAARERIPDWADWYWSPGAEYLRLANLALSATGVGPGDLVADRLESTLFPDGRLAQALESLDAGLAVEIPDLFAALDRAWLRKVSERLADTRVPTPLDGTGRAPVRWVPEQPLQSAMPDPDGSRLVLRLGSSALVGTGAAAGPALMAAARSAGRGPGLAGVRWLARGGRAGAAAGAGSGVCAPAGPLALGCAALAGTITFIATDIALLRLEAAREREAMIAALEDALEAWETALKSELMAGWDALIDAHTAPGQIPISDGFVPARALR